IKMQAAADAVLKSLSYENANNECKKALVSICNLTADAELADYIKACANISSEQYQRELIATAIAQQLQKAKATIKGFACGEEGHVQKQCPKGQKTNKKTNKPCPCCKKGLHCSSQCHSKFYKDGNPLQKQGNLNCGMWASVPQPSGAQFSQSPM
ncbi:GAK10 protein, partial [Lanius ludovicianus]|nr:GAK10 protein [Lanius ludovicianus]